MYEGVSLRDYQIADLAYYMASPKCLNLSDPGTGKTPSVCVMQWWLWSQKGVGTVWVMPKSLLKKNKDELHRFTDFEDDEVVIVDGLKPLSPPQFKLIEKLRTWRGTSKFEPYKSEKVTLRTLQRLQIVDDACTVDEHRAAAYGKIPPQLVNPGRAKVFLMGFDRFASDWNKLPSFVKAVHVDEIHKGFKRDSSRRTQSFYRCMERMDWFIAMTGTLVNGRLDSAYPAVRVIEPRYYPSYNSFYYYHAVEDPFTGKLDHWRNHEKLSEIFGRHGIRRTFEMVYGPEAKVIIPEYVQMNAKQREIYDKFETDALVELEKFYLDGTEPGTSFIRARQIMEHPNHFPDLSDPESDRKVDIMPGERSGKEEALDIHFEDHERTGKPLIVYAALVPQQEAIAKLAMSYGLKVGILNGKVSTKERGRIDEDFRAGKLNCIIASPAVADVGFNWQFCGDQEVDHMIFASLDFLDTTVLQAYRRAIRGKRNTPLRITVLLYEKSLDRRITWIIYDKSLNAHKVDNTQPVLKLFEHNTNNEEDEDLPAGIKEAA
ncbi:helicase-related protein [Aureimonas frigidaquae]|uniref:helicase-related protein n=1 Tax=Aureimonas frigidaquae TaxID=424757 RepID=UPI0007824E52|nr:helicase-related protein [Aureimonas frigidaquae]